MLSLNSETQDLVKLACFRRPTESGSAAYVRDQAE